MGVFEVLRTADAPQRAIGGEGTPAHTEQGRARYRDVDDEIAKLVQRVFVLPGAGKAPGAAAFCAVEAGAGCSWICAQSSEALAAQAPASVCVIDANLRGPSLHEYFQLEIENGFSEAMKDSRPVSDFAKRVGKSNLWVMTAGAAERDLNQVFNPARLHARFSELRAQFDYLLIDTPAAGLFSDGVLLAQMTDGVILVIGSNSTRRESAKIVKDNFDAARVSVLGVVMNRRTFPMPEALYRRL
ncbi:MAG TPA: CpsD/CapB family tyrosine-protein kinase [Candidatus Aquilonibacter sp.]|nr:CpsD/CapB family tyrosine-protein kinase [Candidatus Aquilonibacter sp.]